MRLILAGLVVWPCALFAQPSLIVSPSSLTFTAQVGDPGAIPQTFDVNSTGGPIGFTVSAATPIGDWLSVIGTDFGPSGWRATTPAHISVFVDPSRLTKAGSYLGAVTVIPASGTGAKSIPVTLTLGAASSISASPASLSFSASPGISPAGRSLNILVTPANALLTPTAAVVTGGNWLSIGAIVGSFVEGYSLPVSVVSGGLGIGTYSGSIIVSAIGASNSPLTVPVTLSVAAPPPSSISVGPPAMSFSYRPGVGLATTLTLSAVITPPNPALAAPSASIIQGGQWLSVTTVGPGLFSVSVSPSSLSVGLYSGTISVVVPGAANSPLIVPVTLAVSAGVVIADVLNAASFAKDPTGHGSPVAPGSLVQIYTSLPGATSAVSGNVPFPPSLGGVSVTFNNISARLSAVIPSGLFPVVNAEMPFGVLLSGQASGTANVVVTVNGIASSPWPIPVVSAAPGIFTVPATGQGNAVLVYLDPADGTGKIAAPAVQSGLFNIAVDPIPRGASGYFYATGLGALTPGILDGEAPDPVDPGAVVHYAVVPVVLVGGIAAKVDFAGQAPGYPGVNQINITIPNAAPTGDAVPLQILTADGKTLSTPGATIAVR